jgi:hypothetical protein
MEDSGIGSRLRQDTDTDSGQSLIEPASNPGIVAEEIPGLRHETLVGLAN